MSRLHAETSNTDKLLQLLSHLRQINMSKENLSLNVGLRILVTTPLQIARYINIYSYKYINIFIYAYIILLDLNHSSSV
jgi:hypothetical protein